MNKLLLSSLMLCLPLSCIAAPEFVGVFISGGATYVAVRPEATDRAVWSGLGGTVGEYRVTSYDSKKESLTLKRGETAIELLLKNSSVQPAPTLAFLETLATNGIIGEHLVREARELDSRRSQTAADLADLESRPTNDPATKETIVDLRRKLRLEERNSEHYFQTLFDVARKEAARKTGK